MSVKKYLVSACLLGLATRHNSGDNRCAAVLDFCAGHGCIPVCPEQLGGLPTPRRPAEIKGGDGSDVLAGHARVVNEDGRDLTPQFLSGAAQVLLLARLLEADGAILKEGSPSCGSGRIHDGSFRGRSRPGNGVTAALLVEHGFPVFSEAELPPARPA